MPIACVATMVSQHASRTQPLSPGNYDGEQMEEDADIRAANVAGTSWVGTSSTPKIVVIGQQTIKGLSIYRTGNSHRGYRQRSVATPGRRLAVRDSWNDYQRQG